MLPRMVDAWEGFYKCSSNWLSPNLPNMLNWCSADFRLPPSTVVSGMKRVSCLCTCECYTILLYLSNPCQRLIFSPLIPVDGTGEPSLKECSSFRPVSALVVCLLRTTLSLALAIKTMNYMSIIFTISETFFLLFLDFWVYFIVESDWWVGGSCGYLF